jgi:hypothetical protein
MMPMRFGRLLLPVSLFALAGCQLILGFEDHTLGAGGAGGDTGAGAGVTTVSTGGMGGMATTTSTGGSGTGGAGATTTSSTGGGGAGGGSTSSGGDPGILCSPGEYCAVTVQYCCYDRTNGTGTCNSSAASCNKQKLTCDDVEDCGTGVCCARYAQATGNLQDATCTLEASCAGGSFTYQFWCDPTAMMPCPAGMACTGTSTTAGRSFCE